MLVYPVMLEKGGVGKSETVKNCGIALALLGKKVLLIGADISTNLMLGLNVFPKYGLADVLEGTVKPLEAIHRVRENLYLLRGGSDLSIIKKIISRLDFQAEYLLKNTLEELKSQFEIILIDCSPGWDVLIINVLMFADRIICPVSLEPLALQGLASLIKKLKPIQRIKDIKISYILPTLYDLRVRKSKQLYKQLCDTFGEIVAEPIRYSVRISESVGFGKTIDEYAPRDRAWEDYQKFAKKLGGEL